MNASRTETFYRYAGEIAEDLDTPVIAILGDAPPTCQRDQSDELETFALAPALDPIIRALRASTRSVHVAGISGDVGRDAVLLSLARVLAETGRRILVVDADADGPPLAERDAPGLTDVLAGEIAVVQAVVPSPGYEGMMAFLPIGSHPAKLEAPGAVEPLVRVLEDLRPSYDVMLVSAPCLDRRGKVHPVAIASEVVLLVLSPGVVSRDRIRRNFLQLWGVEAPVEGLVTLGVPDVLAEVVRDRGRAGADGVRTASNGAHGEDGDRDESVGDEPRGGAFALDDKHGTEPADDLFSTDAEREEEPVFDLDRGELPSGGEALHEPEAPRATELPIEDLERDDEEIPTASRSAALEAAEERAAPPGGRMHDTTDEPDDDVFEDIQVTRVGPSDAERSASRPGQPPADDDRPAFETGAEGVSESSTDQPVQETPTSSGEPSTGGGAMPKSRDDDPRFEIEREERESRERVARALRNAAESAETAENVEAPPTGDPLDRMTWETPGSAAASSLEPPTESTPQEPKDLFDTPRRGTPVGAAGEGRSLDEIERIAFEAASDRKGSGRRVVRQRSGLRGMPTTIIWGVGAIAVLVALGLWIVPMLVRGGGDSADVTPMVTSENPEIGGESAEEIPNEVVLTRESLGDEGAGSDQADLAEAATAAGEPPTATEPTRAGATPPPTTAPERPQPKPERSRETTPRVTSTPPPAAPTAAAPRAETPKTETPRSETSRVAASGPAGAAKMTSARFAGQAPFFAVHITSFRSEDRAATDAKRLAAATGYDADYIDFRLTGGEKSGLWYRVIVGRFADQETAKRAAQAIIAKGITDYAKVFYISAP